MSTFLSWFVIVLTVVSVLGCLWLIRWTSKPRVDEPAKGDTMGHVWDGLEEYNNPLPRWWLWMFYLTIIYTAIYLVLYPGLGNFKGLLGWSQEGQYEEEVAKAEERYGPIFAKFASQDIPTLAADPSAIEVGERLYLTYCSQCHGSDGGGARGFPSLRDGDWQWGNSPEAIKTSILYGRQGIMPGLGAALGEEGVAEVTAYVMSMSGREADPAKVTAGKSKYQMFCMGCHGMDGGGNTALGAPNLADDIWVYGASAGSIAQSIRDGRNGIMPPHKDFLGEDKVHLLSAYVYGLAQE
jgi:cytochrome c oxidase cbb3-type subunit 3